MSFEDDTASRGHVRKRRKLNAQVEPSSETGTEASSPDSPRSLHDEANSRQESESRERQKPKYRIHIVQNNTIADELFSQIPQESTEDLSVIRGARWLKKKPSIRDVTAGNQRGPSNDAFLQMAPSRQRQPTILPPPSPPMQDPEPEQGQDSDADVHRGTLMLDAEKVSEMETALMEELAGFDSEGVLSPDRSLSAITNPTEDFFQDGTGFQPNPGQLPRLAAPQNNLRQTTLFGVAVRDDGTATQGSQVQRVRNWPVANRNEPPTHHKLDTDALETWVYPTNLGTTRDYQFNIVARGLYHNLLVALPTGLGKTFIAATIMLNWYRWTKDAQILFVAPTRPLVAQQVDACFHIAGIPRSDTTLLTGNTPPALRAQEWKTKRVFFMTPQTIMNDLKTGICDPKRIILVVVDEAHRATGGYSYVELIKFLRRFNESFRVLALTATPGSTVESVQEVIDGLGIARTEIRTEDSLDIRQYVHQRNIDTMLFDFGDEIELVMGMLSSAIQPVLNKLSSMNAYWSKDPMSLTAYGCTIARQKWMATAGRSANPGLKGMVNHIFNALASIAHAVDLLKYHGIGPFYRKIQNPNDPERKPNKYEKQIRDSEDFKKLSSMIKTWTRNPDFLGHPKLEHLSSVVLNHFIDAGEGREGRAAGTSTTRVMIFAHFRDSAEEIVRVLKRHDPLVRPHVFVGQASSGTSEGMNQKGQQEIVEAFKKGTYNTLVATSIGEEGLDIGEVDLIVCYDASASPIRMLQRMGRTGRKRAGNICVLLMKKKEQDNFEKAKDNYENMQQMIAEGTRFAYHEETSPRIVPKGINPVVDKRIVEIPIENTQQDLPEPKKPRGRLPKMPAKKFHMPDNVITGFTTASDMTKEIKRARKSTEARRARSPTPDPIPDVEAVCLTKEQTAELHRRYLNISGDKPEYVHYPRLDKFPELQRRSRPTRMVGHSKSTMKMASTLKRMHEIGKMEDHELEHYSRNLHPDDKLLADKAWLGQVPVDLDPLEELDDLLVDFEPEKPKQRKRKPAVPKKAPQRSSTATAVVLDESDPGPDRPVQQKQKQKQKRKAAAPKPPAAKKPRREQQAQPPPSPTPAPTSSMGNGIDIMNTDEDNDDDEADDDDQGSDLVDFIDDGSQVEIAPTSSQSTVRSHNARQGRVEIGYSSSAAHREAGEELPDADDLLAGSQSQQQPLVAVARRGVRRAIVDSDDEE